MRFRVRFIVAFLLSLSLVALVAADNKPKTGQVIERFPLPEPATGKLWSLPGASDAKAVVVVFLGTSCPINNAFLPRLAELHREYSDKGVRFVGINSNRQDDSA